MSALFGGWGSKRSNKVTNDTGAAASRIGKTHLRPARNFRSSKLTTAAVCCAHAVHRFEAIDITVFLIFYLLRPAGLAFAPLIFYLLRLFLRLRAIALALRAGLAFIETAPCRARASRAPLIS